MFFVNSNEALAQNFKFGMPFESFYKFDFNSVTGITHDQKNNIFIADGDKLIRFKGYFDHLRNNNQKISSLISHDSILYAGTANDYIEIYNPNNRSKKFTSIFNKVDDQVSHISFSNYGNFILSKNIVYHFQDAVSRKYTFPGIVDFLGSVNGSTLIHDDTNGLSIFVGGRFKIVNGSQFLSKMVVIDIIPFEPGTYLVGTKNNGIFLFDGDFFSAFGTSYLDRKEIVDLEYISSEMNKGEVLIITNKNELISLNTSGNIISDKIFTDQLFALEKDNDQKLYIISKRGVHILHYDLPFEVIDKSVDPIHGPISIYNDKFYWGTNNGLFYSSITSSNNLVDARILVTDTEGKVGKLNQVNNSLLMSHEDGLYDILPKIGARFIPDEKFFDFEELSDDYLLGFSERKTYLLKKIGSKWRKQKEIIDFPIHPKSVIFDQANSLWMVDRDYNLLQFSCDLKEEKFTLLSSQKNLERIDIFQTNNQLILLQDKNVFTYNYNKNEFQKSEELSIIFGKNLEIEEIVNDQYGNVWYIQAGKIGVFRAISNNNDNISFKKLAVDFPYDNPRSIYPFNKNNIFINNGESIINLDLEKYQKNQVSSPMLSKATIISTDNNENILFNKFLGESFLKGDLKIKTNEKLVLLFDQKLIPDAQLQYAIQNDDSEPSSWLNPIESSTILLKGLDKGKYNLFIRTNDFRGVSETVNIPLSVIGKFNLSSLKNILILIGIIIGLIISFGAGFYYGKKNL